MSTSSTVKSLSLTVPCVSETFNPRLLRHSVRPLSLDLSYQSEQTYSKTSTDSIVNTSSSTNSLPLPPRRRSDRIYSLRGDEPPPRSSLGPKPAKFKALSADSKLSGKDQLSKISLEVIPIIQVTKHVEDTRCATATENDDSLDDVFIENTETNTPDGDLDSSRDTQIKFIDDTSPEGTDLETRISITGTLDSDVESQKSVPVERSDADSQVDIHSESSVDTVATAIELRERSKTLDSVGAGVLNIAEDNVFIIHNPSYDSLNTYELLSTEGKFSVIDKSNPKVAKDFKNKMSKESTQRLSKNLAAEITDFFRSSASKLKPPCMDQAKKDFASKKLKIDHDSGEPSPKTPQRLIPRSPYISPVPAFEKATPRKTAPIKQPPFYVWNINSKNAAVCTTLNLPASYRAAANDESKTLKDIENNTRKILDLTKRSNGAPTRTSPTKATGKYPKSASTGQLAAKSQPDPKMSHSDSNNLKTKTSHTKLFSSKTKIVSRSRPSPNRLLVPKTSHWDTSPDISPQVQIKPFKFPSKNMPKINMPLPSPHITVTKVKTQLPCDYTISTNSTNIAKASTFVQSYSLPNVTIPAEPNMKRSWVKKWKSMIHDLFRTHHMEFYIDGVPPCYNFKRSNTWPQKASNVDESSMYMRFT